MSERLAVERQSGVAVATLSRGVTHAIDPELVAELRELLARLTGEPEVRGLVLTGDNEKFFSIGFDLPRLVPFERPEFARFFADFDRLCLELFTFPKPAVAAVTGHAIAGGCILALCCDLRYLADARKRMGLNEIKLAVPVPFAAGRILRHLAGERAARDMTYSGDFYEPAALLALGVADRLLPLERVLPEAIDRAAQLGASPGNAFAEIKRLRVGAVTAEIEAHLADEERRFLDAWYAEPARERLREAMAKF